MLAVAIGKPIYVILRHDSMQNSIETLVNVDSNEVQNPVEIVVTIMSCTPVCDDTVCNNLDRINKNDAVILYLGNHFIPCPCLKNCISRNDFILSHTTSTSTVQINTKK